MKKLYYTLSALLFFGILSAQTDPKSTMPEKPVNTKPQTDSITVNQQVQKESDMKTMDAVKTQDHNKAAIKLKSKSKDTVRAKKNTRRK